MPNGEDVQFYGKTYYGECATIAGTQTKAVTIAGFHSADLVAGATVTIKFKYFQNFNGTPKLNVSSTGAKFIYSQDGFSAQLEEWKSGEIVTFVYDGTYWVKQTGGRATAGYYGNVKIAYSVSDDSNTVPITSAVYSAINGANYQTKANLVTSVSSSSTDTQYPSAKLFYDTVGNIETLLASI